MKYTKPLFLVPALALLASSGANAAVVATFSGGDVGEGIDFSGTVIHAINLGGVAMAALLRIL